MLLLNHQVHLFLNIYIDESKENIVFVYEDDFYFISKLLDESETEELIVDLNLDEEARKTILDFFELIEHPVVEDSMNEKIREVISQLTNDLINSLFALNVDLDVREQVWWQIEMEINELFEKAQKFSEEKDKGATPVKVLLKPGI